jgi:calcium-translocating P-type ATPase
MKIQHLSVDEAFQSLHSTAQGLTSAEAERRLAEFGLNRVARMTGPSQIRRLLAEFTNFFALILWAAAALAFLADGQEPGGGMATLGVAIIGVIVINGAFSFWQEHRAEQAMAVLQKLLPHAVKVLRDGSVRQLPTERVVPGDVLLLEGGDDIPADCRVVEALGVRVNNATVTGESALLSRSEQPSSEEDLLSSGNVLLAGTSLVAGQVRGLVFATGMHTEFGKIAHLVQDTPATVSPLQKEITRLSRLVALFSVSLGVIFFLIGQMVGLPFWLNFLFAIGVIVANVPEGLLPTVTLALAMASQRMAKKQALIRHLPSVETLGSATLICTDKTGTLTLNRMQVQKVYLGGKILSPADLKGDRNLRETHRRFFETALYCHALEETEHEGRRVRIGDPMEVALESLGREVLCEEATFPRVDGIPFDSDRQRMSSLHRGPEGLMLYTKGALEALLPLCAEVAEAGQVVPLTAERRKMLLQAQDSLAAEGLRVLAVASRAVTEGENHDQLETGLTLTGLVGFEDPPRPEVRMAIQRCREAGIRVIMITGDHPQTARAIAEQIGLNIGSPLKVITGTTLRRMSQAQLQLALDHTDLHFARVSADQKMRIVQVLQAKGHVVAVTGDGVNDAPALRQGDIGIAMGRSGTDVARAAADMVLLDDNFASIVTAIEEGRAVYANIRKFLTYILSSNVPELVPYLAFALFKVPLALTIIQILAVDLGTDLLPALALGAEKPEPGLMQQPPCSKKERLIDWSLLARSYLFLGILESLTAMAAFFFVLLASGWEFGQFLSAHDPLYLHATSACLAAIVVMQVANVFLCRSERRSVFSFGPFSNRLIWLGIAVEVTALLLILYTPVGNGLFGTAPVGGWVWLFILPFPFALIALEEVRKKLAAR